MDDHMKSFWESHLDLACTRLEQQTEISEKQQRKMMEQEKKLTEQGRVLEEAVKTIRRFEEQERVLEEAVKKIRSLEAFESERTQTVYEGELIPLFVLMRISGEVTSEPFYLRGYKMSLTCIQRDHTSETLLVGINVTVGKYDHLVKWPFRSKVMVSFPDVEGTSPGVSFEVYMARPSENKEPRLVKSGYTIRALRFPRFVVTLLDGN